MVGPLIMRKVVTDGTIAYASCPHFSVAKAILSGELPAGTDILVQACDYERHGCFHNSAPYSQSTPSFPFLQSTQEHITHTVLDDTDFYMGNMTVLNLTRVCKSLGCYYDSIHTAN